MSKPIDMLRLELKKEQEALAALNAQHKELFAEARRASGTVSNQQETVKVLEKAIDLLESNERENRRQVGAE